MTFDRWRRFKVSLIMKGRPGPTSWQGKITLRQSKKYPYSVEAVCGRSTASLEGRAGREIEDLMLCGYIPVIDDVILGMEPKRTYGGPYGERLIDEDWSKMSRTVQLRVRMMTQEEVDEERASLELERARKQAEQERKAERSPIRYSESMGEDYDRAVNGIATTYDLDEPSTRILARLGRGDSRSDIASYLRIKESVLDGRISKLYRLRSAA